MTMILIFLLSAPMPDGPDIHVLSRPLAGEYQNLTDEYDLPHDFDMLNYDVSIEVFPSQQLLDCCTEVTLASEVAGLSQVRLDLVQLVVDSVWDVSGPLSWVQTGDSLFVTLSTPVNAGDTTSFSVSYSGTPWNEGSSGFGGFFFHPYTSYQMGVGVYTDPPSLGRVIFPCWDHPSDKASIQFHLTVPDSLYAIANGDLVTETDNPAEATTTFDWDQPQPMPTYLAAFAVGDYAILQDSTISWIYYYPYSWDVDDALGSFQNVDKIMTRFQNVYAPYPWSTKFSYVETPKGDMEHLTEVYHISFAINGSTNYDWLLAHEMSHHWWGDCVTETEWNDVWLSESFATYSEAVWMEYYGQASYDDYMLNDIMKPYLNSGETFPITNPTTPAEMWSYTTYQKGASVLHMLRHILGDGDFFDSLHQYFNTYAYSNATTDDFRDVIESVTGEDIDWFFDPWLHGYGFPIYDIDYDWQQSGSDWNVTVDLQQTQSTPTIFTMPLEFMIHGSSQDSLVVMWNDQAVQSAQFTVPFQPVSVEFDPGNYVLCGNLLGVDDRPLIPADGTGSLHFSPNPATLSTSLIWSGMDDAQLSVSLYDLSGRRLQQWQLGEGERQMDISGIPAGMYLVAADGPGNLRQSAKLVVR